MDEDHLMAAFRYVARGPVKAGLTVAAADWPWSSVRAHIARQSTPPETPDVTVDPSLARIDDFAAFVVADPTDETRWTEVLKAELIGRPVGAKAWVEGVEKQFKRSFSPQRRGPKPGRGREAATRAI